MNPTNPGFNLVTVILLVMGVLVFFSVLRLFVYFFGGRSPLRWNAEARVEAAQNPANVLQADRAFQNQRILFWCLFWLVLVAVMLKVAPEETQSVFHAVVLLLGTVLSMLGESITTFLASRGG